MEHHTYCPPKKLYMAPMEGLTGYVLRGAYHRHFTPMDTYFTPFLANRGFSRRERQDVLPEHNEGMHVVPQILTNQAEVFLEIANRLKEYGYREVNLNLGCPSGTVTAKGKGAGFLADPKRLEQFLDQIFDQCSVAVSVKTRVGVESEEEWPALLALFDRYPMTELIIHPRLLKDFYRSTPRMECYVQAAANSRQILCYNGDINTVSDYDRLFRRVPGMERVMLGRGLLANPGLAGELRGEAPVDRETLAAFLDDVLEGYCREMSGDRDVLFRMKELWSYLGSSFLHPEKYLKQMKKASSVREYARITAMLLENCERKRSEETI